jgi:hypothetical protein
MKEGNTTKFHENFDLGNVIMGKENLLISSSPSLPLKVFFFYFCLHIFFLQNSPDFISSHMTQNGKTLRE